MSVKKVKISELPQLQPSASGEGLFMPASDENNHTYRVPLSRYDNIKNEAATAAATAQRSAEAASAAAEAAHTAADRANGVADNSTAEEALAKANANGVYANSADYASGANVRGTVKPQPPLGISGTEYGEASLPPVVSMIFFRQGIPQICAPTLPNGINIGEFISASIGGSGNMTSASANGDVRFYRLLGIYSGFFTKLSVTGFLLCVAGYALFTGYEIGTSSGTTILKSSLPLFIAKAGLPNNAVAWYRINMTAQSTAAATTTAFGIDDQQALYEDASDARFETTAPANPEGILSESVADNQVPAETAAGSDLNSKTL